MGVIRRKVDCENDKVRVLTFADKNPDFTSVEIARVLSLPPRSVSETLRGRVTNRRISVCRIGQKIRKAVPLDFKSW